MYKVFLVEDEIVVRKRIRDSIAWEKNGFIFAGEAPDGEMALPLIKQTQPDILITDIKMPFMDGLELSRYVKKNMPRTKIIILSGHQEFEYAKKAISIGVEEYVLKPVSSKDLLELLGKVAWDIEEEKKLTENIRNMDKYLNDNKALLKESFLNNLIMGSMPSLVVVDKAPAYDIDIFARYYAVMRVNIETDSDADYVKYDEVEVRINEIMKDRSNVIKFNRSLNELIMIFKGDDRQALELQCKSVSETIADSIGALPALEITVDIGNIHERIQGISKSFKDILHGRKTEHIAQDDSDALQLELQKLNENQKAYFGFDDGQILDALRYGNKDGIRSVIETYFEKLQGKKASVILSIYLAIRINYVVTSFLNEIGENAEQILPRQERIEEMAIRFDTFDKLKAYIEDCIQIAYQYREKRKNNQHYELIAEAKQYIEKNYADENMSLNEVANYVNMSPCHFSTVFSQETGETFIQYLTNIRIKKAKGLLNTSNMKTGEIALEVGYQNPHYFSYIFKKVVGCKPRDYRSRSGSESE